MAPPARRRSGYWLLAVPTIAPLLTPLYDRVAPMLWGIPFFYWYQMACVLLAMVVIAGVHLRNVSAPRYRAEPGTGRRREFPR